MKKILFILIFLIIGIIFSNSVNAGLSRLDKTDDVILMIQNADGINIIKNQTYPNIDIYKISSLVDYNENKLFLYIVINQNGTIQNNEDVRYKLWFNTSNYNYFINYSNNINNSYIYNINTDEYFTSNIIVTSETHSINAEFPILGNNTSLDDKYIIDFNACITYIKTTNQDTETYIDCVSQIQINPNNNNNNDNNNQTNETNQNDTNGFIFSIMIISIVIFLYFKKGKYI